MLAERKAMDILGIPVVPLTMEEVVTHLDEAAQKGERQFVVTANAEIIMLGQKDAAYRKILTECDIVLPDGAGVVWAGRTLGYTVPERVAGFDLFLALLKRGALQGRKVYFLGSSPGIAEVAKAKCEELFPGIEIVGTHDGYFQAAQEQEIIEEINRSGAQILCAALGAPKQEFFLARYSKNLTASVLIGIGGSFDVLAGKMQRAPLWMQRAGLEWFFRLCKQPSRFVRMLALPHFVLKVWRKKYFA